LIAATAGWQDRAKDTTADDVDQQAQLAKVVAELDELAARQQQIRERVLRSLLVDQITLSLQAAEQRQAGKKGEIRAEFPKRSANLPDVAPGAWGLAEAGYQDADLLVRGLRGGYWTYHFFRDGEGRDLPAERAQELAATARTLRKGRGQRAATRPRTDALAELLVRNLLDGEPDLTRLGGASAETQAATYEAAQKARTRRLHGRHRDVAGDSTAEGDSYFFGAHRESNVSPAWAAARTVAEVFAVQPAVAHQLVQQDAASSRALWDLAATGRAHGRLPERGAGEP
jgi:hypothetical protein